MTPTAGAWSATTRPDPERLRVVLREAEHEVVPAIDRGGGARPAAVQSLDAAIVDIVLPDGDGVEATRRIREWSPIPILVLSAIGEEDEKVRALQAGADDYVTKLFGPRELVARLQAALRRAAPPETPVSRRTASSSTCPLTSPAERARRSTSPRRVRAAGGDDDEPRATAHPCGRC